MLLKKAFEQKSYSTRKLIYYTALIYSECKSILEIVNPWSGFRLWPIIINKLRLSITVKLLSGQLKWIAPNISYGSKFRQCKRNRSGKNWEIETSKNNLCKRVLRCCNSSSNLDLTVQFKLLKLQRFFCLSLKFFFDYFQ